MTVPTRSAEDTKRVCAALHDLNLSSKRGLADEVIQVLLVLQLREQGFLDFPPTLQQPVPYGLLKDD